MALVLAQLLMSMALAEETDTMVATINGEVIKQSPLWAKNDQDNDP